MEAITACLVSFNAVDALALTVESFNRCHPDMDIRWLVYDNGSTDGAREYAAAFADVVVQGHNSLSHGDCLTDLCRMVETPWTLTLDNDLEFLHPVLEMMADPLADNAVYGSCLTRLYPFGEADVCGMRMPSQWSPNIACGLMKTDRVQRILDTGLTFGNYVNFPRREFFETGGMVWRAAVAAGWRMEEIEALWLRMIHFGSVSTLWLGPGETMNPEAAAQRAVVEQRYRKIQERLQELRAS